MHRSVERFLEHAVSGSVGFVADEDLEDPEELVIESVVGDAHLHQETLKRFVEAKDISEQGEIAP